MSQATILTHYQDGRIIAQPISSLSLSKEVDRGADVWVVRVMVAGEANIRWAVCPDYEEAKKEFRALLDRIGMKAVLERSV